MYNCICMLRRNNIMYNIIDQDEISEVNLSVSEKLYQIIYMQDVCI